MPRAFFGTFFRVERKYYPPRGGSPTIRAVVGASIPTRGRGMRLRAHQRAFRSPFGNLRAPKVAEPHRTTNSNPRRSRRVMLQSRQGVCAYRRTKGLSVRPLETFGHRSWRETHRTVSLSPRRSRRLPRRGFLYGKASARRHKHGTSSE